MQGFYREGVYIEERAMEIAYYIIETNATVRQTATHLLRKKYGGAKFNLSID